MITDVRRLYNRAPQTGEKGGTNDETGKLSQGSDGVGNHVAIDPVTAGRRRACGVGAVTHHTDHEQRGGRPNHPQPEIQRHRDRLLHPAERERGHLRQRRSGPGGADQHRRHGAVPRFAPPDRQHDGGVHAAQPDPEQQLHHLLHRRQRHNPKPLRHRHNTANLRQRHNPANHAGHRQCHHHGHGNLYQSGMGYGGERRVLRRGGR